MAEEELNCVVNSNEYELGVCDELSTNVWGNLCCRRASTAVVCVISHLGVLLFWKSLPFWWNTHADHHSAGWRPVCLLCCSFWVASITQVGYSRSYFQLLTVHTFWKFCVFCFSKPDTQIMNFSHKMADASHLLQYEISAISVFCV